MSAMFKFDSGYRLGSFLLGSPYQQNVVKNEPMLFNCDLEHALKLSGPITHDFLARLKHDNWLEDDTIIDTRVHMLMPGWYPAIPGWHHDDVARGAGGQPDYDNMPYHARHAMALVNGDICPTQFAVGAVRLPKPVVGRGPTYGQWHPMVDIAILDGLLAAQSVPSDRVIYFDWQAFHQGVAATANGWRWFGRASRNTGRKPTNEIRKQVQVYLPHPTEGW